MISYENLKKKKTRVENLQNTFKISGNFKFRFVYILIDIYNKDIKMSVKLVQVLLRNYFN